MLLSLVIREDVSFSGSKFNFTLSQALQVISEVSCGSLVTT